MRLTAKPEQHSAPAIEAVLSDIVCSPHFVFVDSPQGSWKRTVGDHQHTARMSPYFSRKSLHVLVSYNDSKHVIAKLQTKTSPFFGRIMYVFQAKVSY